MSLLKFIPIKLTICLVAGILIGHYFEFRILIPLITTIAFILLLAFIFYKRKDRNSTSFGITTIFTAICLGILSVSLWNPKNQERHYTYQDLKNEGLWKVKITEVLKSNSYSDRYIGHVLSMDEKVVSGKIIINQFRDSTSKKLYVDDEILTFGKLLEVRSALNPYQFDYKNYLKNLGIYHQIQLNESNHFSIANSEQTIYGLAASAREKIITKLRQAAFGEEELGVIQALLLGQRNDISEETYTNYKNAGAVHILAVSGLHIGILLLLLQFVLGPLERLPKGKVIKLIVIVMLLWSFALLAGFSASIVRAVMMFSFVAYALYLNRPSNTFNILALSMFTILLFINPMLLFQVGFQMSYAAVVAIAWIYPMLQRFWYPKNQITRKIWQLLSVSVAAQLGVLPISLFYFHQFPGLFFISNLLIVPALGLILGLGILTIILALYDGLPNQLVEIYNGSIKLMNTIIEWVAQQEAFIFKNISFDAVQLILSYGIILSLLSIASKPNFKRVATVLGFIISFQLYMYYAAIKTNQTETLHLAHHSKTSMLIYHSNNTLHVASSDSLAAKTIVKNFKIAKRIITVRHQPFKNHYTFKNIKIMIIDSSSVYIPNDTDYILITQSPKINIERLIDSLQPKQIIADGSNYHSYITRWKKTCEKRKLPFHYTGEKGAYYFD